MRSLSETRYLARSDINLTRCQFHSSLYKAQAISPLEGLAQRALEQQSLSPFVIGLLNLDLGQYRTDLQRKLDKKPKLDNREATNLANDKRKLATGTDGIDNNGSNKNRETKKIPNQRPNRGWESRTMM